MYKNVAIIHRLLPTSTVQSTERVKIFPQKFFALKVGLGREELQGIVRFGEKYKQWNAAFEAGYAAALGKSIIVVHGTDHQHALKEVDAAALAVVETSNQVVEILEYIAKGTLPA